VNSKLSQFVIFLLRKSRSIVKFEIEYKSLALNSKPACRSVRPIEKDSAVILLAVLSCAPFEISLIYSGAK